MTAEGGHFFRLEYSGGMPADRKFLNLKASEGVMGFTILPAFTASQ